MTEEQRPSLESMLAGFADVVSEPPKMSLSEVLNRMAQEPPRAPEPHPPIICHIDDPEWCGMTIEEFVKAAHGYPVLFLRDDGTTFQLGDDT